MAGTPKSELGIHGHCPKCGSPKLGLASKAESGNQRFRCLDCGHRTTRPLAAGEFEKRNEFKTRLPEAQTYIFTAAQNATPVHTNFWEALKHLAEFYKAEIIVSGYRYKNPTSTFTESQRNEEWWDEPVREHLYQTRAHVNECVEFLGDVFPQATAVRPLTGFETLTGSASCIIPHPKVQLRTVATPAHEYPKIITTTGAVTLPNYSETRAGALGKFHHTLGAVVVEIGEEGRFSMRQISAQVNGAFYDIGKHGVIKVNHEGVTKGHKLSALVMGDTHVDYVDPGVVEATFADEGSICSLGDPGTLVWHDLIDMYSRNRFADDPFIEAGKIYDGSDIVKDELKRGWEFHDEMTGDRKSIIVPSNHTNGRMAWYMKNTDWRRDLANAEFYLETALQMVRSVRKVDSGHTYDDPFTYWGKKLSKAKNVKFIDRDESTTVAGIELQYHGDVGPGAARSATLLNMRRIGTKTIFAHTHEPGTEEGAMCAGTSTRLRLGYNAGPSSWMNSHVAVYPNGKRTHLFIVDGQWTY